MLRNTCYPLLREDLDFSRIQSGNASEVAKLLMISSNPKWRIEDVRSRVRALTERHQVRSNSLLLSSEMFCDCDIERFREFRQLLELEGYRVIVLACIRDITSWSFSTYQQGVKRGSLSTSFDEFARGKLAEYTQSILARLHGIGGDLRVFPYRSRTLLSAFLAEVGEDPRLANDIPDQKVNRSLTAYELQLLRQVNSVFMSRELSERISDAFLYRLPNLEPASVTRQELDVVDALLSELHSVGFSFDGNRLDTVLELLFEAAATPTVSRESTPTDEDAHEHLKIVFEQLKETLDEWILIRDFVRRLEPTEGPFDPVHYALMYPKVLQRNKDPSSHYEASGKKEGRKGRLLPT